MTSPPHLPPVLPALPALFPLHQPPCGSLDMVPTLWPLSLLPASLLPGMLLSLIHLENSSNVTSSKKPVSSGFPLTPSEYPSLPIFLVCDHSWFPILYPSGPGMDGAAVSRRDT